MVFSLLACKYGNNQPCVAAVVVPGRSCPKFRISAEVSIFCRHPVHDMAIQVLPFARVLSALSVAGNGKSATNASRPVVCCQQ
jgi:hypothetical protein